MCGRLRHKFNYEDNHVSFHNIKLNLNYHLY